ncbi:MAG: peptide ABC transporter substrate-binding protein [Alphaproteobacteria bacterium]|nr:peptide ABC transporter substrate-binding protein [Alphaproteobacteria bacterium]
MKIVNGCFALLAAAAFSVATADAAFAQKRGGVLKIQHMDTPPSASMHEEGTVSTNMPFMAIYNNLVMYDQQKPRNSFETIVPDLAESWSWSADGKALTFKLREGVKWHDGKPFTSKDVVYTMELLTETGKEKLRRNPRGAWYNNVEKTVANGDYEVTIHAKHPQPSLLALLASGYSPMYPAHVSLNDMRRKAIGTGPFKLVELKMNEGVKLVRNPDYWKPGKPYLDGIEYTIIQDRSTRMLSFIAGKFDMTFPTDVSVPLLKDIKRDAPKAQCTMRNTAVSTNLIVNRDSPPFDDPRIRKAMALTLDRKGFVDILSEGEDQIAGTLLPPPDGVWGLPEEEVKALYGDVAKNRDQGRELMKQAGYGPDKRLKVKVSTRNIATFRDPAVILIDQLRHVYIDGELEIIDTAVYYNRMFKKEYAVALNLTGSAVDDPDQHFFENYACGSARNYNNYCDPAMTKLFEEQSRERDFNKRLKMVHAIDRKLQEEVARPIIFHGRGAGCWQPYVKNVMIQVNSIYNGWRFEDLWLDK